MSEGAETSRASVVIGGTDDPDDKRRRLETVLDGAELWRHLDSAREALVELPESFPIVVKPDLDYFASSLPSFTDPLLVEHLIDLLHERGYTNVCVAAGCNVADQWLENRAGPVIADLAGYRFVTPGGRSYEVFDLADDLIDCPFPAGSALHGQKLALRWAQSPFRIVFAKNKSDAQFGYGLCAYNLLGVIPSTEREDRLRRGITAADLCVELLERSGPHFAVIDALTSNHGSRGWLHARPVATGTLIASANALLCDWAGAAKMGIDPYASPLNAAGLSRFGLPGGYTIDGDLTTYPLWVNAHPAVTHSNERRDRFKSVAPFLRAQSQSVDQQTFPFKDTVGGTVRGFLTRYLDQPGAEPAASLLTVGVNYFLAALRDGGEAFQILANKSSIEWQDAPLQADREAFAPSDFEAVAAYLQPLDRLLEQTPADRNGLRWRYLDKSVLFEFRHVIPVPYREFVRRVDISRSIQFMTDYIGGSCVPIARDADDRVVRQLERNLYLPQPNWMALFGGKMIDVEKIESIAYSPERQKICWRTIRSANDSAEFDDGSVTFAATSGGHTDVTVMGRQKFALPLVWQMIDLDRWPEVKDYLVAQAYAQFFSRTMENLLAVYENRPFRIGRPAGAGADSAGGAQLGDLVARVTSGWKELSGGGSLDLLVKRIFPSRHPPAQSQGVLDGDGFRHFDAPDGATTNSVARTPAGSAKVFSAVAAAGREAPGFLAGLLDAMRKDLRAFEVPADRSRGETPS